MEIAIVGMCVGETIEVDLPPHLAYEQPNKGFKRPERVPKGATVTYKITVLLKHSLRLPSTLHPRYIHFTLFYG